MNSLSGPFMLDDLISIVENDQIREWSKLGIELLENGRANHIIGSSPHAIP